MCACIHACVCIVGIRKNDRRTSVSFLARQHARTRNDTNHVHDGNYRLLFIQRWNNFERGIHACDAITKRA